MWCVFWLLRQPDSCCQSLPLPRDPYSLKHKDVEVRPVNNPILASKGSREGKSHIFLSLNWKLEIKHSEEGMLKAETGWKLGLFAKQLLKLWLQRKSSWGKLKVLLQGKTWIKRKWNFLTADIEKVRGLYRKSNQPKPNLEQSPNSLQFHEGGVRWGRCRSLKPAEVGSQKLTKEAISTA